MFPAVRGALARASRGRFRLVEFSVQQNHIHLIAEADTRVALLGGIRGVAIRLARAVNRALGRLGQVFSDRYHARALTTPLAVRRALAYVLMNARKHGIIGTGIDPCSSAPWFTA